MSRRGAVLCAAALFLHGSVAAPAMPGEMPWDHYGGPSGKDCTACHFDREAFTQSSALRLAGIPESVVSGETYRFTLYLEAEGLQTAGFLMRAEMQTPQRSDTAGTFLPLNGRTQAGGGAIRSTAEGAQQKEPGMAQWHFSWRAPEDIAGTVKMYIAGVAANDDLSPLGDRVHVLQITIPVEPGGE